MTKKAFLIIFIFFLAVGIGVRIYYIYKLPLCMPEEDSCTIGLMTLDILKGKIPIFFSGQDFTSSLEAIWISFFVALFGISSATLYLGMISQYVVFVITLFWLGRILGGRSVGLFALVYCSIPPYFLLYESTVPYGYHMVLPIFGNMILISSLMLTNEEKPKRDFVWWVVLGFSAGIGFWTHFSIIYYIIPAGVFLLLNKKITALIKNSFIVIVFFIIGGLPFWLYNLLTNFSSFNLYDGRPYRHQDIGLTYYESFKRVINYHLATVLGIRDTSPIIRMIGWVIFSISIGLFILLPDGTSFKFYIRKIWKSKKILLFLVFIAIIGIFSSQKYFSRSPFSYYVDPLYSVIPLVIAYSVDRLNKKIKYSGALFLIMILAFNTSVLCKGITLDVKNIGSRYENWIESINFLTSNGIDSFYADFTKCQPVNYLTKNKILGAELSDGRPPTDIELQGRDKISIHDRSELIPAIKMLCKDFKNECEFYYDFKQYGYYGREINSGNFCDRSNYNSRDAKYGHDRNLDKRWFVSKERKSNAYYQLDLGGIYKVYRIDIFPHTWDFPISFRIKASTDGINWKTILRTCNPHPLFWSGPRLYCDFRYGIQEILFNPVKARYIKLEENFGGIDWGINEMFVFEYLGQREYKLKDYIKPAKQVYRYLLNNRIKFVYADFWLSAKIGKWSKGRIKVLQVENICYPLRRYTSRIMKLNSNTAVVINKEMQEETEKVLGEFNISTRRKTIGGHVIYLFGDNIAGSGNWRNYFLKHEDSLYWAGICPVKKTLKSYSQVLYSYGQKLEREGDREGAVSYYKKALKIYPRNNLTREAMAGYYKDKGFIREYKEELLKLRHLCSPQIRKKIEFENGVAFLGYRLFRHKGILRIDYYWKTARKLKNYTVVFVYFIKDKNIVFQGDYPLSLENPNSVISLKDWVFVERSRVKIPLDAGSGRYEIQIGLYMPYKNGIRIGIKDSHRVNKITIGEFNL